MEFAKRLFVVTDEAGTNWAGRGLADLPEVLLGDGVEVGVYLLRRVKKVELSRKLVKMDPLDSDDEGEGDLPAAPEQMEILVPEG